MGKLQDILRNGEADRLRESWESTEAAGELTALPKGEYVAHIVAGTLENGKSRGTPGYKLTFRVCEGEYAGRYFWHDLWLTEPALPMTKRDLAKIGVTSLDQLEQPLPQGIRCRCKLASRRGENNCSESNKLRTFTVVGVDSPESDGFLPANERSPDEPIGDASPTVTANESDEADTLSF